MCNFSFDAIKASKVSFSLLDFYKSPRSSISVFLIKKNISQKAKIKYFFMFKSN